MGLSGLQTASMWRAAASAPHRRAHIARASPPSRENKRQGNSVKFDPATKEAPVAAAVLRGRGKSCFEDDMSLTTAREDSVSRPERRSRVSRKDDPVFI